MKQKYINTVIYAVDDLLEQIFIEFNVNYTLDQSKHLLVKKHIKNLMKEIEKLLEE